MIMTSYYLIGRYGAYFMYFLLDFFVYTGVRR